MAQDVRIRIGVDTAEVKSKLTEAEQAIAKTVKELQAAEAKAAKANAAAKQKAGSEQGLDFSPLKDATGLSNFEGALGGFENLKTAGGAVVGVLAALAVGFKGAADYADDLADAAEGAGVSLENFQDISNTFEMMGKKAADAAPAMVSMQDAIEKALSGADDAKLDAFKALGVSLTELRYLDPSEVFKELADGYANATDKGKAYENLTTVLGGKTKEYFSILKGGSAAMEEAAQGFGKVSEESASRLGKFNDALYVAWTNSKALASEIAGDFLGVLGVSAEFSAKKVSELEKGIGKSAEAAKKAAQEIDSLNQRVLQFNQGLRESDVALLSSREQTKFWARETVRALQEAKAERERNNVAKELDALERAAKADASYRKFQVDGIKEVVEERNKANEALVKGTEKAVDSAKKKLAELDAKDPSKNPEVRINDAKIKDLQKKKQAIDDEADLDPISSLDREVVKEDKRAKNAEYKNQRKAEIDKQIAELESKNSDIKAVAAADLSREDTARGLPSQGIEERKVRAQMEQEAAEREAAKKKEEAEKAKAAGEAQIGKAGAKSSLKSLSGLGADAGVSTEGLGETWSQLLLGRQSLAGGTIPATLSAMSGVTAPGAAGVASGANSPGGVENVFNEQLNVQKQMLTELQGIKSALDSGLIGEAEISVK